MAYGKVEYARLKKQAAATTAKAVFNCAQQKLAATTATPNSTEPAGRLPTGRQAGATNGNGSGLEGDMKRTRRDFLQGAVVIGAGALAHSDLAEANAREDAEKRRGLSGAS